MSAATPKENPLFGKFEEVADALVQPVKRDSTSPAKTSKLKIGQSDSPKEA